MSRKKKKNMSKKKWEWEQKNHLTRVLKPRKKKLLKLELNFYKKKKQINKNKTYWRSPCAWAFLFFTYKIYFLPPSFLSILKKKHFDGSHYHFSLPPLSIKRPSKNFLSLFFSIFPKIHTTLRVLIFSSSGTFSSL